MAVWVVGREVYCYVYVRWLSVELGIYRNSSTYMVEILHIIIPDKQSTSN